MNDLQEKWLKALESGEYEQGVGQLKREDKYCCLGVACEVMGIEYSGFHPGLSEAAGELVGLTSFGDPKDDSYSLTYLNDNGKTFKEIAEIVRSNPSNYFRNV